MLLREKRGKIFCFEKARNKRGLSPIIATVLLIVIGLILAVIIFMWARSFLGEDLTKNDRDISLSCEEASFRIDAIKSSDKIYIVNQGAIPIFGIEIRLEGDGSVEEVETLENYVISAGESTDFAFIYSDVDIGDTLLISPILLGETETYKDTYICGEDYSVEAEVA